MKSKKISAAILLAAVISGFAVNALACGPFFPNNLLDAGDSAVLQPPLGDFARELQRLKLPAPKARAVSLAEGQNYADQSADVEMTDLAAALKRKKIATAPATVILQAHLAERMKLNQFNAKYEEWAGFREWVRGTNDEMQLIGSTNPPPEFPTIAVTPGLPREFALYFQGAIYWHEHDNWRAQECWQKVLALPAAERRYKSTWAEFMLGRELAAYTNADEDGLALKHFQQVRALAQNGFADSAGLAVTSLGEAARIFLRRGNFEKAFELYLEQFAAQEATAVNSLRFTAGAALSKADENQLLALAKNPRTRRVLMAYLVSRHPYNESSGAMIYAKNTNELSRLTLWLGAVESAGVNDLETAEQFALAAYQTGDFDAAQRWINRSPASPVSNWLQAKLFLRAGKIEAATELLAKISHKFPQDFSATNTAKHFAQSLFVDKNPVDDDVIAIGQQAYGELGVLRLARREYVEALDALLRSSYWMDAAYVAERVLTTDELKTYVDHHWPASDAKHEKTFKNQYDWRVADTTTRGQIRYLLARRLAREARFTEARNYFPEEWKLRLDALAEALKTGRDISLRFQKRADALLTAAFITRTNGMELLGTELEPDWFIEDGNFQAGVTWEERMADATNATINLASADEIRRAQTHHAEPEERWHYRDVAEDLKAEAANVIWEGAKLLPDNSDELAHTLVRGGTLYRSEDHATSERFYRALVRRCGRTLIGQQADKLRWFPELDENGNLTQIIPWIDKVELTPELTNAVSTNGVGQVFYRYPMPGNFYVAQPGDSFTRIARAASKLGQPVTVNQLMATNANLNPAKLRIGQLLLIPDPSVASTSAGH